MAEKQSLLKNEKSKNSLKSIIEDSNENVIQVYFEPAHYTCFESIGSMSLFVTRKGGDINKTVYVDYLTENGTAVSPSDYTHAEGTLVFYPGETRKEFQVDIIDDDVYEEDEHFYARITNIRYNKDTNEIDNLLQDPTLKIANPFIATVMILDDDHGGIFMFAEEKLEIVENCGIVQVKVIRTSGARGKVKVPFKTIDATAIGGKDFEKRVDFIVFENNETE